MKRLLLVFMLIAPPVFALDQPILVPMMDGNTGANRFTAFMGGITWNSSQAAVQAPYPGQTTATLIAVYCAASADPGGVGKSWTVQLEVGGTPDTSTNCVIGNGTTTGSATGLSVSIAYKAILDWKLVPASTPAAARVGVYALLRTNANQFVLMGATNGNLGAATVYYPPSGANSSATEANSVALTPGQGTGTDFCFNLVTAPNTGHQRDMTVRYDGGASSLAVSFGAAESGVKCDTGTDVFVVDKRLAIETVDTTPTSDASTGGFGIAITPQNSGDSWQLMVSGGNADNSGAHNYVAMGGAKVVPNATETATSIQNYVRSGATVTTMHVRNTSAAGAAPNEWTYQLNDNTSAVSGWLVSIAGAVETIDSVTPTAYSLVDGHFMDIDIVGIDAPTASRFQVSFITNIAAATTGGNGAMMLLGVGQ